ncbi:hypothetical protein M501DRAFT_830342 [Patellaria atrata CBS 101060]|uniref:Uncharacterized protein n=1 Tax=Patellaria atrata CBS 101060 TaxID=1346257 RepID=A0A9P4S9V8_9PEZI|nr:hypothetical protein M501DRAFT_830342 [Patellaria atrata CBS 101060]
MPVPNLTVEAESDPENPFGYPTEWKDLRSIIYEAKTFNERFGDAEANYVYGRVKAPTLALGILYVESLIAWFRVREISPQCARKKGEETEVTTNDDAISVLMENRVVEAALATLINCIDADPETFAKKAYELLSEIQAVHPRRFANSVDDYAGL